MAIGARQVLGVDWAVAITGVAGPGGGSYENPVGTVYFAWADAQEVRVKRQHFRGDRARIQSHAVAYALFKLLQLITLDPHQDQTEEER